MSTAADYLTQTTLLRLTIVMALVLGAHASLLPVWESVLIGAVLVWRALAAVRQWRLPNTAVKVVVTLIVFVGVMAQFNGKLNGQEPGTALLAAMAALKLMEMRSRRDVMVTVFLMYFILLTHFLLSQEIWTVFYMLGCAVAITALLVDVNHAGQPLPMRTILRLGGQLVALSLPVMLLFFVLFPRIPGPLWGLPAEGGSTSGISDEMTLGDISKVVKSEEVAFRVEFDGSPPPRRDLYWRGPVLTRFNGRTWSQGIGDYDRLQESPALLGSAVNYEITLEKHSGRWLFALDLPDPRSEGIPREAMVSAVGQLLSKGPVRDRIAYRLRSHTRYRLDASLPEGARRWALRLPRGSNPRSVEQARGWREQGLSDLEIVNTALTRFREEPFSYTLEPPRVSGNSIDQFLFGTRSGFCEHYAAAFTFQMRAAGIPARIVTGYQGAETNDVGGYLVVRQSNAHAWAEVWMPERGWVRVDPTSAVAPERVERGAGDELGDASGSLLNLQNLRYWAEARWDWTNAQWNRWVLGFGPELQRDFMRALGIVDWGQMVLLLTVLVTGVLALVSLALLRQYAPSRSEDVAVRLWRRGARLLRRYGLMQEPHEGPRDFAERVMREKPELAQPMQRLLDIYLRLRYIDEPSPELMQELTLAVRQLKPS